ncbi:hypothetical protein AB0L80_31770 [Streptomyces sp. NPDC052069]|uniref:hypothetical protein n=1 Tax=Streptomyces sp. NPDC052069 TaxID=3154650 RepID=UPI00342432F6
MPILAGQVVTAAQLNRLQPKGYHAIGSGTVVGAVTNGDVPDATVTFTTETAGATYKAWAVWDVDIGPSPTTGTGTARISVDGTVVSPLATFGQEVPTDRLTVSQNYSGVLAAAGSHTLKLVASPAANQTIQGANSTITVIITEAI